jgi:hypothetical protein
MRKMDEFSSQLIFEIQKAFYDERGKGARYRLTTLAVPYIKAQLGNDIDDLDKIKAFLKHADMLGDLDITDEEVSMHVRVTDCIMKGVRDKFTAAGMQPLSCPIANIIMEYLERKSGLSPELLPMEISENCCCYSLAKMPSTDVVKE